MIKELTTSSAKAFTAVNKSSNISIYKHNNTKQVVLIQ